MTESASSQGRFPDHVDEAVRAIAQLHAEHHGRATALQRTVNRISALVARPLFVAFVIAGVASWMGANLAEMQLSGRAVDPPAFPWLQVAVNLLSLFIVTLVLVAQKHEDELNARRDILTLELATLSERKIAKIIELLEELRRDSPHIPDRVDHQTVQMAQPADPQTVLAAERDTRPKTWASKRSASVASLKKARRNKVARPPFGQGAPNLRNQKMFKDLENAHSLWLRHRTQSHAAVDDPDHDGRPLGSPSRHRRRDGI